MMSNSLQYLYVEARRHAVHSFESTDPGYTVATPSYLPRCLDQTTVFRYLQRLGCHISENTYDIHGRPKYFALLDED
jgi:hypothetical protein